MQASNGAEPLTNCMLCRQPVSGIARYGQPLKRRAIELAERKFVALCGDRLQAGQVDSEALRLAAEEIATMAGDSHFPMQNL